MSDSPISDFKEIPLCDGKGIALVDSELYDYLNQFKWYLTRNGYARAYGKVIEGKRETFSMHRLVANTPEGMVTDHINHNKLDNRSANLRVVTNRQNGQNRLDNKSGYPGVTYFKRNGKWLANPQVKGHRKHLGYFDTPEEAYQAYMQFVESLKE